MADEMVRITHVVYVEEDDAEYVTQELEEAFNGSQVGQWRPKGYPKTEPVADGEEQSAREFFAADHYDDEVDDG